MKPWWQRLSAYAGPHRRGMGVILTLTLLGVGIRVLEPWPLKLLVDVALLGQPLPVWAAWLPGLPGAATAAGMVGWLAGGTVALFVAARAIGIAQGYVQTGVGSRMVYDLGGDLFDHLQRLSLRFHSRRSAGDLVSRVMSDSGCVRDVLLGVFLPVLTAAANLAAMIVVMWWLEPALAAVALLVAPVLALLIRAFDRPMSERSYEHQQVEGQVMAQSEQVLTALPMVQVFGQVPHEVARFRAVSRRSVRTYLRSIGAQLQFRVGVGGATAAGTALVMAIGGWQVLRGELTVGDLLVLLAYLGSLYAPMQTLAYLSSGFADASGRARRVFEVLDEGDRVEEAPGAGALPHGVARGHLRLEQVSFAYTPGRPVLHDVTLDIRPGERVALVGPTGAGKSTLAALIPRLFDPTAGRVLLDGHDVRTLTLASVRAQVGLVLQEPLLLPLSVAENIAYGRPGATRAEVEAAARAAQADEFIRELPAGYETVLGERGATLSGGQRQRLAVARALLKDAPVLVLDEPTAALDVETEAELLEALERLMAGRTVVVIAHRLSTVRRADRIVVLDGGRVVEVGTHQQLLAHGGLYARMCRPRPAPSPVYSADGA